MPTTVKTWVFLSDAEGLVDEAVSATTAFAWLSSDGSPANGCVQFSKSTSLPSLDSEKAAKSSTGETWETWGVPAGATVTSVQVTAWKYKIATINSVACTFYARVIDTGGSRIHAAGDLISAALGSSVTGWTAAGPETSRNIDSGSQASTTDVRLELAWDTGLGGGISDFRFDTIELTITYITSTPRSFAAIY